MARVRYLRKYLRRNSIRRVRIGTARLVVRPTRRGSQSGGVGRALLRMVISVSRSAQLADSSVPEVHSIGHAEVEAHVLLHIPDCLIGLVAGVA